MKKLLLTLAAVASFTFAQAEVTLKVIEATDIKGTEVPEKPASGNDNGQAKHVQPLESLKIGDYSFSFAPRHKQECSRLLLEHDRKGRHPYNPTVRR